MISVSVQIVMLNVFAQNLWLLLAIYLIATNDGAKW